MASVYTVGEVCKKCYSCVRACPTKAIRVLSGQAHIIDSYCISCGRCVAACSQGAKRIRSSVDAAVEMLCGPGRKYALLAPSFPASFLDLPPDRLVGAVRALGFDGVFEVAFGADLVSRWYHDRLQEILSDDPEGFLITSPCPAVVEYVEKFFPALLSYLAPVASPMEAMARVVRAIDPQGRLAFIGPCVAKKEEAERSGLVGTVLTYVELLELFRRRSIEPAQMAGADFDPPHAELGRIYPVTGGLLKSARIGADILTDPVYVVEGAERVGDILSILDNRVKKGLPLHFRLFDLLFCEGCIGGPVMANNLSHYERKKYVVRYMQDRPPAGRATEVDEAAYRDMDLSVSFRAQAREDVQPTEEEIRQILSMTGKNKPEDELNCGACGYLSCREKAKAVHRGTAEVSMCLPYLIAANEKAMQDLRDNQTRLIQAEKLASMGQMAAGIAHEINNPLGVVLMYAHLLKDELGGDPNAAADADRLILEAERTRRIVRGILNFAREEKVERRPTDINGLLRDSVGAVLGASHGERIRVEWALDPLLGVQWVDGGQLRQVFDNIVKNALEVMPDGGTIRVRSGNGDSEFSVSIEDTGPGIPEENLPKMFSPFFTTKKVGKGTGLGLSVCYGIVKMHGGSIQAANSPGGGACFTVRIKHFLKEAGNGKDLVG